MTNQTESQRLKAARDAAWAEMDAAWDAVWVAERKAWEARDAAREACAAYEALAARTAGGEMITDGIIR